MEFRHVLEQRRAVRQYQSTPVERALIERLLDAAVLAPSAMNLQPWAFAVVTLVERIDEYARRAKDYLTSDSHLRPLRARVRGMLDDPQFNIFYHAPALVIVLSQSEGVQAREDCCLAAQTFMLAARDAGLGTCWVGLAQPWLDLAVTKAELGIAPEHHVIAPIVLGYPTTWPSSHGRHPPVTYWLTP